MRIIATMLHCNEDLAGSNFSNFSARCALAAGSEEDGLSLELLAGADSCVRIELFGMVDSLDITVTIGIVLHAMGAKEPKSDAAEAKKRRKIAMQAHAAGTEEELKHDAAQSKNRI